MKPFKTNSVLQSKTKPTKLVHLPVFAEPEARQSYQRLFEVAKLNFQSIETPRHIAKLLWEG